MPKVYDQLCAVRAILESYYKEMQDLEFTVEDEKLYMLQCRTGKRSPMAAFQIALDHATQPLLTRAQANDLVKKGLFAQKVCRGCGEAGHHPTRCGQPYFFR